MITNLHNDNGGNMSGHVGIIGVGLMGHGIASNVVKHGYRLSFLEHPGNQPVDALMAAGATPVQSIKALGEQCDTVILCVSSSEQIEAIMLGADGLLSALRAGKTVIDCSTALPESTLRVARTVAETGAGMIDAPMTRTPKEAAQGRLNLIVGGDTALVERCMPLLSTFAENIVHAGAVSAGHRMKLLHNFVSLGFSAVLAEAAACAKKAGVDPARFVEVLAAGGGEGAVLRRLAPYVENGDDSAFRFSISNALKDMNYYTSMAAELEARHQAAWAIREIYEGAEAIAGGHATVPELVSILGGPRENG
jgi:3-hydroxyisobutyrate dehydrogenase-like beta-hydroxyacid dehydrogenase